MPGKTTLLRDITRQLADRFHKLVMVVDTSEEIAGGGDTPHACIGAARRMLGTAKQSKYEALEEAVANHGPEVSHTPPHQTIQTTRGLHPNIATLVQPR